MNLRKYLLLFLSIFIVSCTNDLDDNLKLDPILKFEEAIAADSDLFKYLEEIASDDERPDKTIACIDFIYPITLFVFDENDEFLYTSKISDDDEFSDFLTPIDETYSISISFPITSILSSGEEFTIENKEELKESIDSCLDIERVGECETLMRECLWKVGYSFIGDNPYLGKILQESDGFLTLNVSDEILVGSWTPFIIESELHININLIDTTAVGNYFNSDWKAEFIDENSLKLRNDNKELILNQRCDPDFTECGNFDFEACETELDSGIAEFILDDYTFCIFDTLEFDLESENFTVSYYETEDDAIQMTNAIASNEVYTTSESNQMIFVRINDIENDLEYYLEITLIATTC